MAKSVAILRYVLFCVFFAAGVAAMALAILADELHTYCNSKILLTQIDRDNLRIERLIADYAQQIENIHSDPNLLTRLRRVTLGHKLQAEDTAYPQASKEQLKAVEKLFAELDKPAPPPSLPQWIERISAARNRQVMFFSGAGLILVAFIFFAAAKDKITPSVL